MNVPNSSDTEFDSKQLQSLDAMFQQGALLVPELAVSGRTAFVVSTKPATGNQVFRVPLVAGLGALKRSLANRVVDRVTTELAMPQGKRDVLLPPGLHVVMGATGAGKSSLIKFLDSATEGRLKRVNVLEPFDEMSELKDVTDIALDLGEAMAMAAAYSTKGVIPMIDSFRALVHSSTGGNAGKSGVNMAIFPDLTRFNNLLALQGVSMLAAINPLSEKEQYEEFKRNVESSVVGLFEVTRVDYDAQVIAFTHAIRPRRAPVRHTVKFDDRTDVDFAVTQVKSFVGQTFSFNDSLLRSLYPA